MAERNTKIVYIRQEDIVSSKKLAKAKVSLIGAGAVGSFAALAISKMGLGSLSIFDEDGITNHNFPNQFYRKQDVNQFKVESLASILDEFADTRVKQNICYYKNQKLEETVIVAPDSMATRKLVWNEFLKQPQCKNYIEARMGAEVGMVYTIREKSKATIKFYESTLKNDSEIKPLPCTARSIIYNVLGICAYIGRSYKSIIMDEKDYPREIIINLAQITEFPVLVRK